jgi:hypothetical protein
MAEIVNKRPSLKSADAGPERVTKRPKDASSQTAHTHWPAEGPHARQDLINEAATPGAGLFSSKSAGNDDVDPGAG